MNKRELINGIKEIIGDIDYKPISVGAGSVSLVSNTSEIVFSYKTYPNIYVLGSQIIGYKLFPEVEEILVPLFEKHQVRLPQYTIYKQSRSYDELFNTELSSVSDLNQVSDQLQIMVKEDILPFFEEFQNTTQVMNEIDSLPKENISKFINTPPLPRIMILKRINERPDWKEYCEWAVGIYKTMASGPNGKQHETIKNLVTDLHTLLLNH